MLAVGGLPVFNVVVVKFYINCMVAINRCMIVLVLILIYTSLTVNYSYLRIIRLTMHLTNEISLRLGTIRILFIDEPSKTYTLQQLPLLHRSFTTRDPVVPFFHC